MPFINPFTNWYIHYWADFHILRSHLYSITKHKSFNGYTLFQVY